MHRLRSIVREIVGLFVDDGSFAAAILLWVALVVFVLARALAHGKWLGCALFSGLAILLIESVLRFVRRAK